MLLNISNIEEYLKENKILTYRNIGTSMLPLLKEGRDLYTLKYVNNNDCKLFDVVLFKRNDGQLVLHRIIDIKDDMYITRGDNSINSEIIPKSSVIGIMTSFTHKGKEIYVNDKKYIFFVKCWNSIYKERVLIKNIANKFSAIKRHCHK